MVIDSTLAESHTAASQLKFKEWDWEGAEKEIQQAIKRNPNSGPARHLYGFYLAMLGRVEESHIQYARAQQLDPLSRDLACDAAQPFIVARQYPQAIARLQKALDLDQNFGEAHEMMADIYESWGK